MNAILKVAVSLMTGGFLKGYRTQILGGAIVAQSAIDPVSKWLVGDQTFSQAFDAVTVAMAANPAMTLGGLAIITAAAKINRLIAANPQ